MFKSDEERLKVYKDWYKKLRQMWIKLNDGCRRSLTPVQKQAEGVEKCLHEIIGIEAVLGVSPEERIAVMDEVLGPELKQEVIPALKYCMLPL